jgi:hypothetical protein
MSRYFETPLRTRENSKTGKSITSYSTTIYETVEEKDSDIRILSTDGDRCDLLAQRFYGDSSLWWFIARVNNLKTMNVPAGTSLRIPAQVDQATSE